METNKMVTKISVDLAQFAGGYANEAIEEGKYLAQVVSVDDTPSKAGKAMLTFGIQLLHPVVHDEPYAFYCVTEDPTKLWNLARMLKACRPDLTGRVNFNFKDLVGDKLVVSMILEPYMGELKGKVGQVAPASTLPDGVMFVPLVPAKHEGDPHTPMVLGGAAATPPVAPVAPVVPINTAPQPRQPMSVMDDLEF